MSVVAHLGLGSNLGDRQSLIAAAIAALEDAEGIVVQAVSPLHETRPCGGPPGQPPFLNAAVSLETDRTPLSLLRLLQDIESRFGRRRQTRWDARTLDLDLLLYGDAIIETAELVVPHPRMSVRRFVLAPLADIAPTTVSPLTGRSIAQDLSNLDRRPSVVALGPTAQNHRLVTSLAHRLDASVLPPLLPNLPAERPPTRSHAAGSPDPTPIPPQCRPSPEALPPESRENAESHDACLNRLSPTNLNDRRHFTRPASDDGWILTAWNGLSDADAKERQDARSPAFRPGDEPHPQEPEPQPPLHPTFVVLTPTEMTTILQPFTVLRQLQLGRALSAPILRIREPPPTEQTENTFWDEVVEEILMACLASRP